MILSDLQILFYLKIFSVIIESVSLLFLLLNKNKFAKSDFIFLSLIVLFQLIGDFGTIVTNGYISSSVKDATTDLLVKINYRLFLISFCILVFRKIVPKNKMLSFFITPQAILSYVIVVPFIYKFIISLVEKINSVSILLTSVEMTIFTVTTLSFAFGVIIISLSTHRGWTFLSSGILISCLGAWGKRFELYLGDENPIKFYEFIWTFGLTLQCLSLLSFAKEKIPDISIKYAHSIFTKIKTSFLGAFYLSILAMVFFEKVNPTAIKLVTLFSSSGTFFITFMNHNFEKIHNSFLYLVEKITQDYVKNDYKTDRSVNILPNEYREAFEIMLKKHEELMIWRISEESKFKLNTEILAAISEVHKKISHDIRSPLTAINTALTEIPQICDEKKLIIKNALKRIRGC